MHLVRIHVKPRAQHRPSLSIDQADPAAVTIRHGHGLPISSEQSPPFRNPIWQYLPFVGRVSNTYILI